MSPRVPELRIGISSCLLGAAVRYDGGHKRDGFVTGTLAPFASYVAVCPELELGLGVPREAIHLRREGGALRLVGRSSGADHTAGMQRYAARRTRELAGEDLDGYILKKDSPSCGMERVKVHEAPGTATRSGRGLFAEALLAAFPLLPVEEEGRLEDAKLRENFIERVFAYRRMKTLFAERWSRGDLVRFHTAEKMTLLAHDRAAYGELGRLVAAVAGVPRGEAAARYAELFMGALARPATRAKHTNVLHHMSGHLKRCLDPAEKRELLELIEDYRRGLLPLVVPVTLLRHHVRRHAVEYLAGQTYLEPHPKELMLRNHV